jgi:hypothetical protein
MDFVSPSGQGYFVANGYSGNGAGLNNPAYNNVPNVGPIQRGYYQIGPQGMHVTSNGHAPTDSMTLTPLFDVSPRAGGHMIHGGNGKGNSSESNGCIIMGISARDAIGNSGTANLVAQ